MTDDPLQYANSLIPNPNVPPDYSILASAIASCSAPVVQQLLAQNPKLINFKAWHGQTPLHRACLGGNYAVVSILLQAGADPNLGNDFDETPLHYAAKRGILPVFQMLVNYKGAVTVLDKNGRGMIHHAAETGSIYMMHYLAYVHGLSLSQLDYKRQLPLHLTARFGHADAFKYLLKKQRCDLFQADSDGNTALHLTVLEGYSFLTWLLLEVMGSRVLRVTNNDGYTPRDLASQRDRPGHKELVPILKYYDKHPTSHPQGPVFKWYWFLFMPGTVYAVAVMASLMMGARYQGVVVFGSLFGVVFFTRDHMHRLTDVSRWPNPIYAGMFAAGTIHTTIYSLAFLLPSMLQEMTLLTVTSTFIVVVYYLYISLIFSDPGAVRHSEVDEKTLKPLTIADLCHPQQKIDRFCIFCEIVRPQRTKHCRLCDMCYRDMDHHCLFLLKCIGGKNHVRFIWFILVTISSMLLFIGMSGFHLYESYPALTLLELGITLFHSNAWYLSLIILNAISVFWGISLILFQFRMMANGFTTVYQPRENVDILNPVEKCMNIVYFLLGKRPYSRNPFISNEII